MKIWVHDMTLIRLFEKWSKNYFKKIKNLIETFAGDIHELIPLFGKQIFVIIADWTRMKLVGPYWSSNSDHDSNTHHLHMQNLFSFGKRKTIFKCFKIGLLVRRLIFWIYRARYESLESRFSSRLQNKNSDLIKVITMSTPIWSISNTAYDMQYIICLT